MKCIFCNKSVKKLSKWINPNQNCHYKCWMSFRHSRRDLIKYDNFLFNKKESTCLIIKPDQKLVEDV